ncbi:MAG: segregation/condensation protein A [Nanoarchaeota archaeon]
MEKEGNIKQQQVQDILFNREIGWQEIIYDLINTEQLNPWDIDIIILTGKYLETIQKLEEADFFISSKVLLAAALLLRIKSEILLNQYIKSIDEILFGKKEKVTSKLERIELDGQIPDLIPRSPMPRFKRVSLKDLMEALNKAIITENRRIKKEIVKSNAIREVGISLPKRKLSVQDKIKQIFSKIIYFLEENKNENKINYNSLVGEEKHEKIFSFVPLLYLEHQKKIWLEQNNHFGDIYIWERKTYWKNCGDPFKDLEREEVEGKILNSENESESEVEEI